MSRRTAATPTSAATPSRSARYVRWAKKKRAALIHFLGGKCIKCGSQEKLEFDHPDGRDWICRSKNRWQRMILYWRDARAGKVRLLCRGCNGKDGAYRRWAYAHAYADWCAEQISYGDAQMAGMVE